MIFWFLTPAVLFFLLVFLYPVIRTIAMSFFYVEGVSDSTNTWKFVGLDNYLTLMKTAIFKESIKNMVDTLNDAVGSNAIRFALVENNGKYSIVLKINAANTNELMSAAMNTAMGLVNSGYSYIGIDNNGLLYLDDETNALCISLQAIVDAVMNS